MQLVSNSFSAYGGIRWGSGQSDVSNMKELKQNWVYYLGTTGFIHVETHPCLVYSKVTTLLLIMSNDGDGAVPWYQGIKLVYGPPSSRKRRGYLIITEMNIIYATGNRRDLSIRMRQFFDYYLLCAPAPEWMFEGTGN
ncbi:MAG: hypothetical protein IPM74_11475 [Crocinitomicaceae bacterium]|nr:hypothetical protein [Crocinitomicaceae bacterium]